MAQNQFDVVIEGGRVVDGTGNPWLHTDVAINDGRVVYVGKLNDASSDDRIDATGKWVVPGFIDAHAHSDFALTINRSAASQLGQGITTEVVGNCGFGAFPRTPKTTNLLFDPEGVDGSWSSASEYFSELGREPTGDNVAPLLGLGTVRKLVMGMAERRPNESELEAMKAEIRTAMEAGTFGVSTGLDYAPSSYATVEELISLCEVVAEFGGVYASHLRGYTGGAVDSVKEAIEIGARSGAAVQLSHMNVFGRANWGMAEEIIQLVNEARENGVDVTGDIMAYPTAGSWWAPRAVFPASHYDWASDQSEQLQRLRDYLGNSGERRHLRTLVEERRTMQKSGFHEELLVFSDWCDIYMQQYPGLPEEYAGRSVSSIAEDIGDEPVDVFLDLLVEGGDDFSAVHIAISQDDADEFIRQPWMMFGTDSIATTIETADAPQNTIMSHPRHYASYVRVLVDLVRERQILTMEDAVRKMTSLAAHRFGLRDRGVIRPGSWADVVIFDLSELDEVASWRHPRRYPKGINAVLVNGGEAVTDGRFSEERFGRALQLQA